MNLLTLKQLNICKQPKKQQPLFLSMIQMDKYHFTGLEQRLITEK